MDVGEYVILPMGHHRRGRVAREDVFAADDAGQLDPLACHLLQAPLELLPLRRARGVVADRLVRRAGRPEDRVSTHKPDGRRGEVRYDAGAWGIGELWFEDGRVAWHELPRPGPHPGSPPPGGREVPRVSVPRKESPDCDDLVPELVARLQAYFAGDRVELGHVALDLEWCTPFQRAVADAL